MSLSGPADPLLTRLIRKAIEQGSIIVAAGAEAPGEPDFPASLDGVIAVTRSRASGRSPDEGLQAPGSEILAAQPGGSFDYVSGSSFAAAVHVESAPFPEAELPQRPDIMVVDPPRAGLMAEGVAAVLGSRPRRLLHVACSAKALARDLEALTAGGYRLRAVHLADLFPHTEHVEVLALLE